MKHKQRKRRWLSVALAIAMVMNLFPASALAEAGTGTVKGDEVTIEVGADSYSERENDFNKGWKFYLGTSSTAQNQNFDDSSWDDMDLPHDFSIIQSFTTSGEAESGFLPGGTGWYRKSFTLDSDLEGKNFMLNFDGVYMHTYVYVNGTYVGEHHYGYTNFAFDITEYLDVDGATENVIAVKVVNEIPSSRWYSGSGIYRDVTLIVTDDVHVDLNGTTVTTPNIASGNGTVNVEVDVVNSGDATANVTVTNTVYRKGAESAVASASTTVPVNAGSTVTVGDDAAEAANPVVNNPELWSIKNPNLYTVVTELSVDGTVVDTYETDFGFRYFSFDSNGFHLNGKNVKLNGVCMHHDQGALGSSAYYDAMYRQLSKMKDMGCNAIRTSHNPADKDFIAICNELGLVVIEEVFDGLVDPKNGNSNDFSVYFETAIDEGEDGDNNLYNGESGMTYSEYATRSIVKRDRNAPSIIAWSFGNEIQEGTSWTNVSRYDDICADFITWINDEDGTRPATSGDNNRGGSSALVDVINTITNAGGIAGFNYANSASTLYSLAQSYGGTNGVIIAAETASATNSRGQYTSQNNNSNSDGKYHLTSYDTSSVSWGITAHDSIYNTYQYDCVAGEFVWTGFDYIGEPTPWNGTGTGSVSGLGAYPNSSYFGIVETTGFEKDTYYLYRSQWNKDETTVHLVTAWDSDNYMLSSSKTPVWVYSNAPVVKLYRDGTLIGTATRAENKSAAGHIYYTYTTESNNSSICSTSSGSGADGLYAVFNVAYTAGTLSAKAFEADGTTEITLTGNSGKNTVTTPGTVSKLAVSQDKKEIAADGSSLAYFAVDVVDADGNLDTTATNNIVFSLTGNGEIVGVDNGDQATTAKYQQSSVLTSSTSANINAYAGKALVIVRSTEEAGSFTVNITSSGLTGGSATVTTAATKSDTTTESDLVSYTMVRDYSVKAGTVPTLETTAAGTMADGTTVTGTIAWETISEDTYNTVGDYTIKGTLTFADMEAIEVTAKLHVIANVIAMRNIATATTSGVVPTLPNVVNGVLADGTVIGEFNVVWDTVSADALTTVGDVVTVNGTATVLGEETLPVTCTIRVAQEVETESTNIAPQYLTLEQDIESSKQSDVLTSIANGTTKPGDNTSERWTNWNNRTTSATATLTLTWATAHMLSGVNIYYYYDNCCAYPESIVFSYSLNGVDYTEIEATAKLVESYSLGAQYTYTFAEVVNPVGLKVTFTQQSGTTGSNCVGVTEFEVMTYAASLEYNTSADLSGITVGGTAIDGFNADTLTYEAESGTVAATTDANAGITVLPVYKGVVRILTISEDGSATKTYEVTVGSVCEHTNTKVQNAKEATCTEAGYTGDTVCTVCGETVTTGSVIPATGHVNTEVRNAKAATCTEEGYTGDTYCTDCGTLVSSGTTIAVTAHTYDSGVVTKEPTETENGIKTYTCTVCGATKTEEVEYAGELKAPSVSLTVKGSNSKLVMTGQVEDYENLEDYYEITAHGILYVNTSCIGTRVLTTNTSGRTRVNFSTYTSDGSFTYNLKPGSTTTSYTMRAFLTYTDTTTGKPVTVYSDTVRGSYNTLK